MQGIDETLITSLWDDMHWLALLLAIYIWLDMFIINYIQSVFINNFM